MGFLFLDVSRCMLVPAMSCCCVAQRQGFVRRDIERAKVQCQVRSLIPYEGMAHEAQ